MATYKLFPEKDAAIYSMFPSMNAGLDVVLETSLLVGENYNPLPQASRILIKFNQEEIEDILSFATGSVSSSANLKTYLRLFKSEISGLTSDTIIDIYPVSGSWSMGTGKYNDNPITDNGVSWGWKNYSGSSFWIPSIYSPNTTASYSSVLGGGTWYTASIGNYLLNGANQAGNILDNWLTSSISQSFSFYGDKDINVEITPIVNSWVSQSIVEGIFFNFHQAYGEGTLTDPLVADNSISIEVMDYSGPYLAFYNALHIINSTPTGDNEVGQPPTSSAGYYNWQLNDLLPVLQASGSFLFPYFHNIQLIPSTSYGSGSYSSSFYLEARYPLTSSTDYSDRSIWLDISNWGGAEFIITPVTASLNPNDGLILKIREEFVDSTNVQPQLKYFSRDTHTIYPPYLEFKWNDYSFNTGSSTSTFLTASEFTLSVKNHPSLFHDEEITKFRIFCSPKYPTRTFQTSSVYLNNYYLPLNSTYAVQDMFTNEIIIDFDDVYSKISADNQSNYFNLYMNGLEPQRYYKVLIKTIIDGSVVVLDNDSNCFKIK